MSASRLVQLATVAGAVLALSCGSSTSRSAQGGGQAEPALHATCAPAAVQAGGAGASCTAELLNATGEIAWTLSGPGALSAAAGPSVQYLPPATLEAAAVAHVVAAAAGLSAPFDVAVEPAGPPPGLTVAGRAVDVRGFPLEGIGVEVPGLPATTTDAGGAFAIAGVTAPYDLVLSTEGVGRIVEVYAGLTRTDPAVAVHQAGLMGEGDEARTAKVGGSLTGGDPVATGGHYQGLRIAPVGLAPAVPAFAWGGAVKRPPSSASWSIAWQGAATLPAAALGVQWRVDSVTQAPTAYWLGAGDVTLADGETVTVPAIALEEAPVVNTHGQVDLPTGWGLQRVYAELAYPATGPGPGPMFPLFYDDNGGAAWAEPPTFTYVLPAPEQGVLRLCARAGNLAEDHTGDATLACVDATGRTAVALAVPVAPQPYSPADGANAVGMDTAFAWQAFDGGVHALEVTPEAGDAPTFLVFTADAQATLPAAGRADLALPAGAAYSWRVRGFAPVESVDALASPGAEPLALDEATPGSGASGWGRSGDFHFTVR